MIQTDDYWCVSDKHVLIKAKTRKYVRCPTCGRRLLLKEVHLFGKLIGYGIPPHKIRKTKRKHYDKNKQKRKN